MINNTPNSPSDLHEFASLHMLTLETLGWAGWDPLPHPTDLRDSVNNLAAEGFFSPPTIYPRESAQILAGSTTYSE